VDVAEQPSERLVQQVSVLESEVLEFIHPLGRVDQCLKLCFRKQLIKHL
jgi:hypothetical protein